MKLLRYVHGHRGVFERRSSCVSCRHGAQKILERMIMRTGVRRVIDGSVRRCVDAWTRIGHATEIRFALILRTSKDTFNKCISDSPLYLWMPVTHPVFFFSWWVPWHLCGVNYEPENGTLPPCCVIYPENRKHNPNKTQFFLSAIDRSSI